MEHQTEGLGLRPPDRAEERTNGTAKDMAGDAVEDDVGYAAEEPDPDFSDERPEDTGEQRQATGESRVDAALGRLDELEGRPVTEHRAVFEDVHRRLRDVLGELDPGRPSEAEHAAGAASRPGR